MAAATEWALFLLNAANTSAALLVPCCLVTVTRADIIPGFVVTISTVVLWMKLVSYAHCNYDLRWGLLLIHSTQFGPVDDLSSGSKGCTQLIKGPEAARPIEVAKVSDTWDFTYIRALLCGTAIWYFMHGVLTKEQCGWEF